MAKCELLTILSVAVIMTLSAEAADKPSPKCWHCVDKVTPGCNPFDPVVLGEAHLYSCNTKKCVMAISKSPLDNEYHVIRGCIPDKVLTEEFCALHTNKGKCLFCDTDGCNNGTLSPKAGLESFSKLVAETLPIVLPGPKNVNPSTGNGPTVNDQTKGATGTDQTKGAPVPDQTKGATGTDTKETKAELEEKAKAAEQAFELAKEAVDAAALILQAAEEALGKADPVDDKERELLEKAVEDAKEKKEIVDGAKLEKELEAKAARQLADETP